MSREDYSTTGSFKFLYLMAGVILSGTLGYTLIEGWSWFDALYMTVITISTIGYGEIQELSDPGRIFTIALIFTGVGVFSYGLKEQIENSTLLDRNELRRRRMLKTIRQLKGHTIVCGFGRMGQTVCEDLFRSEQDFVVIENDPTKCEIIKQQGYLYIEGDASDDNELIEANIESARAMVICIDSDADTLYTLVAAKNINPDIFSICRTNDEIAKVRLTRIGADKIVQPITVTGKEVARDIVLVTNQVPYYTADLSFCSEYNTYILEHPVEEGSDLIGSTGESLIETMNQRSFVTIGILNKHDQFTFISKFEGQIEPGDRIVGAGDISQGA
ncbi:MAG: potassium channel family protein [Bdellovibrionales bacterium]|nr:potassium channel family protein [Bdellovibrionales bacterium]